MFYNGGPLNRTTTVIIGAGIVGLHIARALQEIGQEVWVLDAAPTLAEQTSGRNSGVIHAGVFYKTGSFKERICIEGNRLTYEWLERLKVSYRPCGKWIVPEEGQEEELEPFYERIRRLPITPPILKSPAEVTQEEPNLRSTRALFIPSTGILDAAGYVKALAGWLENKGCQIILNCEVQGVKDNVLITTRGEIPFDLAVNSAGLFADVLLRMAGLPHAEGYEIRPCRGDYCLIQKKMIGRPVYHLPYLLHPGAQGLGVHLTPTLDDQTLLGPNAFFIEEKTNYRHRSEPHAFEEAVRFYLPRLNDFKVTPAYSGNRPKLYLKGEPHPEFLIIKDRNWIHLLGIESPGLTAAPALANHVAGLVQ